MYPECKIEVHFNDIFSPKNRRGKYFESNVFKNFVKI